MLFTNFFCKNIYINNIGKINNNEADIIIPLYDVTELTTPSVLRVVPICDNLTANGKSLEKYNDER